MECTRQCLEPGFWGALTNSYRAWSFKVESTLAHLASYNTLLLCAASATSVSPRVAARVSELCICACCVCEVQLGAALVQQYQRTSNKPCNASQSRPDVRIFRLPQACCLHKGSDHDRMEEEPSPAPGRDMDDDAVGPPSAKRPRLFQQDLNPSPSPSYAPPAAHTAAPVTSSVLNTRAILSVLKGRAQDVTQLLL